MEGNQNFDFVEGNHNFNFVEGNQNFYYVEVWFFSCTIYNFILFSSAYTCGQTVTLVTEGKNRKFWAGQRKKTEKADLVMEDC